MAQETEKEVVERENFVGSKPLDYSKFEDLDFESDEDDCHPNIEIGTWRRLKERMRKEKGIKKKEPHLVDKWNVTTTNKNYHIDPTKPPKTTEEQQQNAENTEPTEKKTESVDSQKTTESIESEPRIEKESDSSPEKTSNDNQTTSKPKQSKVAAKATKTDEVNEPYKARSNPQTFLDSNLEKLRKFANIKKDSKADKFVKKNPDLVHEASEGFLITFAVDRAVEGAQKPELARLSRRCLMIHNLVQSCSQQNVSPQIGVQRFYAKILSDAKLTESYKVELNKQVIELMERIETRRVERLAELQDIPDEYDEEEKAPLGPGGLDPTEVLNSLPKEMQDAFINQDTQTLKECLSKMDVDMAEYHMKRCVDAGLWVQPEEDASQQTDDK